MQSSSGTATTVAFFSRGRGRGHVVPDIALVEELQKLDHDIDVRWVSYGTGAATLRELGHDVIDLELPDDGPFLEVHMRATRVIAKLRPHVVVSHEEFSVAPAAKLFNTPVVLVTDYFIDPRHIWMQCLAYADEVIFIDEKGIFPEPPGIVGRIYYAGPLVRRFAYAPQDRERARSELGLTPDAVALLVLPGNWSEERAPIFDLVLPAFRALPIARKILAWMAGQDCGRLHELTKDQPDVLIKETDWQIDRWMVAADLAITKATRKTSLELSSLGVPSISLSHGLNPIDEIRVSLIRTNTHLDARTLDSRALVGHILELLGSSAPTARPAVQKPSGLAACARRLSEHIAAVRQSWLPNADMREAFPSR